VPRGVVFDPLLELNVIDVTGLSRAGEDVTEAQHVLGIVVHVEHLVFERERHSVDFLHQLSLVV